MARAAHLIHWFLLGCVATSSVNWFAAQLPQHIGAIVASNLIVLLIWGLCWLVDDGLIKMVRLDPIIYYTILISWGIAHLIGLGIYLWIYHPNS